MGTRFARLIFALISLVAFVYFVYKFEYVTILGLISSSMDGSDFFNALFFFFSISLGIVLGWSFFSVLLRFFKIEGLKKFLIILFIVSAQVLTPFYLFKNSIGLNAVFCPSLTLHGLVSGLRDSAPAGIINMAKSMCERCVLKNFLAKRARISTEKLKGDFNRLLENIPEIGRENIPFFAIIALNMDYPYLGSKGITLKRIRSFTDSIESINSVFTKTPKKDIELSLLDRTLNKINEQVVQAFNKTFTIYINNEYSLLRSEYLAAPNKGELKVDFDFMELRLELLKENLSF